MPVSPADLSDPFIKHPFGIIGHRGAAGHATENSIEAFEIAFAAGVDAIEFDVKYLCDQLFVFHDDTLDRLTNRVGNIDALSLVELNELRLLNGEPIPRLEGVWERVPPSIGMNIELKGPNTGKPVAEFVQRHSHHYLVSSFYAEELRKFREFEPNVASALLTRQKSSETIELAKDLGVDNIHVYDPVADLDYLQPMLDNGFTVYVFTVNESIQAQRLRDMGVAAIFTDVPQRLNRGVLAST